MAGTFIKNVTLIDPGNKFDGQNCDLRLAEGRLQAIGPTGSLTREDEKNLVEAENLHLSPGWIDMQVQLSDPGFEYKETLDALGLAAARGGFTSIVCYPNTSPSIDRSHYVEALLARSKELPVGILPTGNISHKGEGKELAELFDMHISGAVAFTDGNHPLQSPGLMQRALLYGKSFDALLMHYPTDASFSSGGQMHEGKASTLLGMKGIPIEAESMGARRDLQVLEYAQGRMHFHPITDAETLSLLKQKGLVIKGLSTGTNLCYLTEQDDALLEFDANYKILPPIRDSQRKEKLLECLREGLIDVVSSGHTAQGIEEKKVPFEVAEAGMLALQTFFPLAYESLVKAGQINLSRLIELISLNPRKILRLPQVEIKPGGKAEYSLFQPEMSYRLEASDIPSRAKNSPYLGREFQAKVWGSIRGTRIFRV